MRGKNRTKLEQRRFQEIQERGCVPCYLESIRRHREWQPEPCDIHHTAGGNNHLATYGNCPWHHRGIVKNDWPWKVMQDLFGPSMARSPREYRLRYGTEEYLVQLQNQLLGLQVWQIEQAALNAWQLEGTRNATS